MRWRLIARNAPRAKALNYTAFHLEMQAFFLFARTKAWIDKSENQLLPKNFRQKLIRFRVLMEVSRRILEVGVFRLSRSFLPQECLGKDYFVRRGEAAQAVLKYGKPLQRSMAK